MPYINMNPPRVYTCSPSWTPLPPPYPSHPSGSSQCTSPKHPVSCIKPGLAIHFLYDIIHVSIPFSQIIQPSPSPSSTHTHMSLYLSIYITCTWMFMEAFLFVVVKTWRQLKHPSAGGLVNKFLSIYTIDYYSTIKRNELPIHIYKQK